MGRCGWGEHRSPRNEPAVLFSRLFVRYGVSISWYLYHINGAIVYQYTVYTTHYIKYTTARRRYQFGRVNKLVQIQVVRGWCGGDARWRAVHARTSAAAIIDLGTVRAPEEPNERAVRFEWRWSDLIVGGQLPRTMRTGIVVQTPTG